MFQVPILFIVFNRFDTTERVFEQIKKMRPVQLFIASDGPRKNNQPETEKCNKIRYWLLKQIDWKCEVKTLFRTENLGCGKSVSGAITWFFDHVEEGIILEDDTMPNDSFFTFCETALGCFRDHPQVMHISGSNFQFSYVGNEQYFLSKVIHVWGWATWKRAWNRYNFELTETIYKANEFSDDDFINHFWKNTFKKVQRKEIDTWDYQWTYTVLSNCGFAIMPQYNLVSNIGFDNRATHTTDSRHPLANLKVYDLKRLVLDGTLSVYDPAVDIAFHKLMDWVSPVSNSIPNTSSKDRLSFLIEPIKKFKTLFILILKLLPLIFLRRPLGVIIRNDSIGDYILFRNVMKRIIQNERYKSYSWIYAGNEITDTFVRKYDGNLFVSIFSWYGNLGTTINSKYNLFFLKILDLLNVQLLINPVLSCTKELDTVASLIRSKNKIAAEGTDINYQDPKDYKSRGKIYSLLIKTLRYSEFELFRNCEFLNELTGSKVKWNECDMDLKFDVKPPDKIDGFYPPDFFSKKVIAIFPFAGSAKRAWSFIRFRKLIDELIDVGNRIVIFGDGSHSQEIDQIYKNNLEVVSQLGKIDLALIPIHLSKVQLVISNESMAVHLAAAISKPCICLSNGNHFGRFNPYPTSVSSNVYTMYSNEGFAKPTNRSELIESVKTSSDSRIDLIKAEDVINLALNILENGVCEEKIYYSSVGVEIKTKR